MQKRILVGLAFMLVYNFSFSCDLCTVYLGIQPNDFKSSVGIRYRFRSFEKEYNNSSYSNTNNGQRLKGISNTKHNGTGLEDSQGNYTYTEEFNSYDITVNTFLHPRWQLGLSTYFSDNYVYQNDSIIDNIGGIGDINMLLKFQLINSQDIGDSTLKNKWLHRLLVGSGFTLPTGNFNKSSVVAYETVLKPEGILSIPITRIDPHIQAGTGGFGYLFLIEYLVKINAFGVNFNGSYKLNTTNKNDFKFANRFNSNLSFFSLLKTSKKTKIMPQIGLSYEQSKRDTYNNEPYMDSGGQVLFSNLGFDLFYSKLRISTNVYIPIYEHLYDDQPLNKWRIISQLNYYF